MSAVALTTYETDLPEVEVRVVLTGAVGFEAVPLVEGAGAGVSLEDPEEHGLLADGNVQQTAAEAGLPVRLPGVDRLELERHRRVLVLPRSGSDEPGDPLLDRGRRVRVQRDP